MGPSPILSIIQTVIIVLNFKCPYIGDLKETCMPHTLTNDYSLCFNEMEIVQVFCTIVF